MSLAAAARANNRSQLNTVTEIKYSSRNNTARDHSMIAVKGETPVHGPTWSFGTVLVALCRCGIQFLRSAVYRKVWRRPLIGATMPAARSWSLICGRFHSPAC
jgi:hypothetical protein